VVNQSTEKTGQLGSAHGLEGDLVRGIRCSARAGDSGRITVGQGKQPLSVTCLS
jgi:hypothetical protein